MRESISESDGGTFYQAESSSGATEAVLVEARSKIQGDNRHPATVTGRFFDSTVNFPPAEALEMMGLWMLNGISLHLNIRGSSSNTILL